MKNFYEDKMILKVVSGSHLYGTSRHDSDVDLRGIYILPAKLKIGVIPYHEEIKDTDIVDLNGSLVELDECYYEIGKFFRLATKSNPNILDILFADEQSIRFINKKGKQLLKNRDLFLSKDLKRTFSGYAYAQLKKMRNHNRWIRKYPDTNIVIEMLKDLFRSKRIDFDWIKDLFSGELAEYITEETPQKHVKLPQAQLFDPHNLIGEDLNSWNILVKYVKPNMISYSSIVNKEGDILQLNETIKKFLFEQASFKKLKDGVYVIFDCGNGMLTWDSNIKRNSTECGKHLHYILHVDLHNFELEKKQIEKLWHWKLNRNKERSILEDKYGYDTKCAMHLVRLLLGAKQILWDHTYNPRLTGDNLKFIKSILNGEYSYQYIIDWAEGTNHDLDDWIRLSVLPKKLDLKKINDLLLNLSDFNPWYKIFGR